MQWQMESLHTKILQSPWAPKSVHWEFLLLEITTISFLNSKVKLTELGIHILDSIKTNQAIGDKVPMVADEVSSDDGPRHASTIG